MLMNTKDLLFVANEHNFAVPAFNIGTGQILKGVIECCEEKHAPVILAIHPSELEFQGDFFIAGCIAAANASRVPMAIHLDHGSNIGAVQRAIRDGFTSVMIDASGLPYEENIAVTKKVVAIAHPLNVSVEAELGTIGTISSTDVSGIHYTDPAMAKDFVEKTDVDLLAVAIGTAHGLYPKNFKPELKLDILSQIKSVVRIPLVLHGGSSNPDTEIAEAVKRGVNKINISSDIKAAFYKQCRITLENQDLREPFEIYPDSVEAMKKIVCKKIDLFNDADKTQFYRL